MEINRVVITTTYKYMVDTDSYDTIMAYEKQVAGGKYLCEELEEVDGVFDVFYGAHVGKGIQVKVTEKFNNDFTNNRIKDIINLYVSRAKKELGA